MFSRHVTVLVSLLVLALLVVVTIILNRGSTEQANVATNPVEWIPFTQAEKDAQLANGKAVMMFGKPGYHVGAEIAAQTFDDPEIQSSFQSGRVVAMLLEYDDWQGAEIRELFKRHGHTKHPIALLYIPAHAPIKLDPFSATDILKHLRKHAN